MAINLKPIQQQVILVNGADGELGEALVKRAISRGARVFMVGEDEIKLGQILKENLNRGAECAYNLAQCMEADQLRMALEHCVQTFGTVDTWINAVDIHFFSLIKQFDEIKARHMLENNLWSAINGSRVAGEYLGQTGGSIINVGTILQKSETPLAGFYLTSKEAVTTFSENLRKEFKNLRVPVDVSCINSSLSEIDTINKILRCAEEGCSAGLAPNLKKRYANLKSQWRNKKGPTQLTDS